MSKFKFSKEIKLSKGLVISNKQKCFIVAEISANHSGNINILKKTMLKAKESGADAIKIQTYEANTITLNSNNNHFMINDSSIWKGKKLYNLYKSAETPFNWHKEIFFMDFVDLKIFMHLSDFSTNILKTLIKIKSLNF